MMGGPVFSRDRASLSAHLLYDSYDPNGRVFVQRDGSLGLGWRIGMKDSEVCSPSEIEAFSSQLGDFFRHLPEGSAAQFVLMAERDIHAGVSPLYGDGETDLDGLFEAHGRLLEKLSVFDKTRGTTYVGRTFRAYFTLRIFPKLGGDENTIRENYERAKGRLLEDGKAIESFFTQSGMGNTRLDADEFVALIYRLLNPRRAREGASRSFRRDLPIRDQVVRSSAGFEYERGILHLDGTASRVLSMVQIPERTSPGMTSRPPLSGVGVLDLIPEAVIVVSIGVLSDSDMRRRLEKRDAFAWRQLQGPRRRLDLLRIKEDAEGALGQLLSGKRALSVRLQVLLSDETDEGVLEKSRAVTSTLDRLGIEMVEEDALGLTLFLHSLPFQYDPASDRGLKRAQTMVATNVADLLPLYGSFRGTATPDVVLQNRRGEPVYFSLFDSDVAPHAAVTGVSGAGKSYFMNYSLASIVRRGGHVLILDRGESYRNLCEVVDGQYVEFDPDRPLRINPVGRAEDMTKERLLFVKDILSEMCAQGEEPIRKEERTVLENAVTTAVGRKGRGEVTLSEVYQALQEEVRRGPRSLSRDLDRLVLSFKPFLGSGAYAGFFDGPSQIDFSKSFTVFEMKDIALRKEVAPSLLMAILYNAAAFCGAPENLGRKKYVVIDEAWTLLQSAATARFIENALRTYRKINTAAIMVTQQVSDFSGVAGAAIRANAPNRVFLKQTAETLVSMQELFDLTPEVREALASLVTDKGNYSEMLIETPSSKGIARLVPSPELHTVFSTDGDDRAALRKEVEKHRRAGASQPLLAAVRSLSAGQRAGGNPPGKVA